MPVREIELSKIEIQACNQAASPLTYFRLIDLPLMSAGCADSIKASLLALDSQYCDDYATMRERSDKVPRAAFDAFAAPMLGSRILTKELIDRDIEQFVALVAVSAGWRGWVNGWPEPKQDTERIGPFWVSGLNILHHLLQGRRAFWNSKLLINSDGSSEPCARPPKKGGRPMGSVVNGAALRKYRGERSQEVIARICEVDVNVIQRGEGNGRWSRDSFEKIARGLKLKSPEDLKNLKN